MGGLCVVEPVDHGDAVAISWRPIMKKQALTSTLCRTISQCPQRGLRIVFLF